MTETKNRYLREKRKTVFPKTHIVIPYDSSSVWDEKENYNHLLQLLLDLRQIRRKWDTANFWKAVQYLYFGHYSSFFFILFVKLDNRLIGFHCRMAAMALKTARAATKNRHVWSECRKMETRFTVKSDILESEKSYLSTKALLPMLKVRSSEPGRPVNYLITKIHS